MTEHEYWVLHSPYPDKSWRGIEKCASTTISGPGEDDNTIKEYSLLLFETESEAQSFINKKDLDWFRPVKVMLSTPDIREVV